MDRIVTMRHLSAFIGRYSTKRHRRSVEQTTGWDVEGNFLEKIPILALRNRDMENESPLSWRSDRNLHHAISLTLDRLKAWQAFRPLNSGKIARKVKIDLPDIIKHFQQQVGKYYVRSLWDIMDLEQNKYNRVVILVVETVGNLSSYKSSPCPMLGSKIMHLFLPEFFPIWDTAWIKNRCLVNEPKNLETWLPHEVVVELNSHGKASSEYGWYFALMLQDLKKTGARELRRVAKALIRHSKIPEEVIDYHFFDISTIVFEFCLLGKHIGCEDI